MPNKFYIDISDEILRCIRSKVADFPWDSMPNLKNWEHGTNLDYMKELCAYWLEKYDWRKNELYINSFAHYKSTVAGIDMHFIIEKGEAPNSPTLLISHGWPSSFYESMALAERLAHPSRFGLDAQDSFDVVLPSLPGFGFSAPPDSPYGPRKIARVLHQLMTNTLGYKKYIAHGSDWGSAISSWLGYDYEDYCSGIHICFPSMRHVDGPMTSAEEDWVRECETSDRVVLHNGYRTQQATKPQTLSYAMMDSPVGIAAWIVEKFHGWSDLSNGDIETVHTKDGMLTNIMIYLITKCFCTSTWIYYGRREEGGRILGTKEQPRVNVPTAVAIFPKDSFPWPPYSYANRLYNIVQWTEMPRGGHFVSLEEPDLLSEDLKKFAHLIGNL